MDTMQICRDAVLAHDIGIGCALVALDQPDSPVIFLRDPAKQEPFQAFLRTALSLLDDDGRAITQEIDTHQEPRSGEVHLVGEVLGYARFVASKRILLALVIEPTSNVGVGWATLSMAASQLETL
jgi:hypothetical protein